MERRSSVRFAPSEIARMEKLVKTKKEQVLGEVFCQKLAEEFNRSPGRVGSKALQATQVQGWLRDKFPGSTAIPTTLPTDSEEKDLTPKASVLVSEVNLPASEEKRPVSEEKCPVSEEKRPVSEEKRPVSEEKRPASEENALPLDISISNEEDNIDKIPETEDMEFEARSSKDFAWYDVATFLAYRKTSSGEFEVRVRFEGFGAEEDEWINVRKAIRLQSIPLESSQCRHIREGDLVLCFMERNDDALHFDAHVLEIQRKQHDIRGCRCVFLVRYDHDGTQERVNLRRLSRRPKYS
ncbi:hypothetical protein ABZP36_033662 [Zizania latifolia]